MLKCLKNLLLRSLRFEPSGSIDHIEIQGASLERRECSASITANGRSTDVNNIFA